MDEKSTSHKPVRRLRQYLHPDGRTIHVATTPEEAATLRPRLSDAGADSQFDLVIRGSPEHLSTIREIHTHHENTRDELRQKHADLYTEFERVHTELDTLAKELSTLSSREIALDANFARYGYSAHIRTREAGSSASSVLDSGSSERDWDGERRRGQALAFWKRPVIRQYFHKGLIWRASERQEVASFELFVDLLYVGIIAINGDRAAETPTGETLLQFSVTFILSWRLWSDLTLIVSYFETNDITQRISILFVMACLTGYTTNINDAFGSTYAPLVSFYLTQRLFQAVYFVMISYLLPVIRGVMISNVVIVLVASAIWIASIHLDGGSRLALIWIAIFLDLFGQGWTITLAHGATYSTNPTLMWLTKHFQFYPAVNIEHKTERTNAFVTLVFGYSVVVLLYQNGVAFGINAFFGKAILGLVQAFCLNMIYFEIDNANIFVHAIRRSALAFFLWSNLQLPFIMSYILAAGALARVVLAHDCLNSNPETLFESSQTRSEAELSVGIRWFYSAGLGVALACMGVMAITHRHKIVENQRMHKGKRLVVRFAVAIILICLPLASGLNSLQLISTTTGLVFLVLCVDIYGMSAVNEEFWNGSGACRYSAECRLKKRDMEAAMKTSTLNIDELTN